MKLKMMILFLLLAVFVCLLSACTADGTGPADRTVPADGSWKTASLLVADARYPLIGTDGNGNMTSVWEQSDGIYSAYFDIHLGWRPPQKIMDRTTPFFRFSDIHLAVNVKGDAVVAWNREDYPNFFIQTVKYTVGSGWGTPQQLTPPSAVFFLDVALDANNNAIIAWTGRDFPVVRGNVFASRSSQFSQWDAPQPIGTNIWEAQSPRIAIDNAGNAFVIWVEGEFSDKNNVYVNRYTANSGWSTPQQIATNISYSASTNIAFDKTGNAMAVWGQSYSTDNRQIYSCRYRTGIGWEGTVAIVSNTLDTREPALTVDSGGNFRTVWVQTSGSNGDVYSSRNNSSSGWETSELIGNGGNALSPRVATDGLGNVFVAWQQYDPTDIYFGDAKVYANRYSSGSGWEAQRKLTNALGGAEGPELAVDPQGHATVIWSQRSVTLPGTADIFTSRFQ